MAYCQMGAETFIICLVVSDHEKNCYRQLIVIEHTLCGYVLLYTLTANFTSTASKKPHFLHVIHYERILVSLRNKFTWYGILRVQEVED